MRDWDLGIWICSQQNNGNEMSENNMREAVREALSHYTIDGGRVSDFERAVDDVLAALSLSAHAVGGMSDEAILEIYESHFETHEGEDPRSVLPFARDILRAANAPVAAPASEPETCPFFERGDCTHEAPCTYVPASGEAGAQPVAWHIGNADGTVNSIGAVYIRRSMAEKHIASYEPGELDAAIVPLYAAPIAADHSGEAGARYELVTGCNACRHCHYLTSGKYECMNALREFDQQGKPAKAPNWCPLPVLATPATARATKEQA